LHFYPISVREAKHRWPEFKDEIKPDQEFFKELGDERRELASGGSSDKTQSLMVSISSTVKEIFNYFTGGGGLEGEEVLVVECWCHDYTKKKQIKSENKFDEVTGAMTSIQIEITEPKYTGEIRYIVACNAGKVVLEDKGNPSINPDLPAEESEKCYLYDKFPFCAVNSIKDTVNAWGISDIEQLEQLNIEMDKALSQFILFKDKSTRLKIINPTTSGVPNEDFTNYPGVVNPVSAMEGQGIRYLEPPQMPVDLQASIQLFKELFFLIGGTFDLDQAQSPGRNVIAYKAIAALMERAATMMRGKIRSYSRLIRERGRMYLSHVQNWYTEDRWITYQDKSGIEMTKKINGMNLRIPAKLTVVTGSTMPVSKVQQREEALTLFQQHAIDQEDLLDKLDWGDRTNLIQRMKQGPVGEIMGRMQAIGVPPPMLQMFQSIFQGDQKQFQSAVQSGKMPNFMLAIQQLMAQMQGQQPAGPPQDPAVQAEAALKQAQAQKTMAEIAKIDADKQLVMEQINSEKVDQQVKLEGVSFDKQNLVMQRAKTVSDVESAHKKDLAERAKIVVSAQKNRPGYNEGLGLKSNDVEQI